MGYGRGLGWGRNAGMYYVSRAENHGASSGRPALLDRFVDWKIPRMLLRNKLNQILAENLLATRRCWAPPSYTISRASSTDTHSDPSSSSPAASSSSSSSSSLSDLPPHTHPASTRLLPVRPSTSKHPRPSPKENTTLAAAALLSRSPLLLRPLTEFEDAYYQYQRELNLALAKPVRPSFFFRPGSHAAKAFDLSLKSSQAIHLPSAPDLDSSASQPTQQKLSLQNLEREPHRSIYLFVKLLDPQSQKSQWQLPTSQILPTDNLTQASLRAVHSGLGPNMDIWSIGKVPATVYTPSPGSSFDKVWVMPQRILRGKPVLSSSSSSPPPPPSSTTDQSKIQIQDFAWFTTDEIREKVDQGLWDALEPVLRS